MVSKPAPSTPAARLARYGLFDRSLIGWSAVWTAAVLVVFGLSSAIIPNPVFGRGIPPEPFAVAVWLVSAPLMGLAIATYFAPPPMLPAAPLVPAATPDSTGPVEAGSRREASTLGTLGGLAAFVAIGCPTCNKIALVLLGTGGAASVFGPLQPFIGLASLVLLAVTVAWRLRLRARGGACAVPARQPAL